MTAEDLAARVQRLEDIHRIEQLMARRAYLHSAGRHEQELEQCWARADPDIRLELEDWGLWVGQESVRKCYVESNPFPNGYPGLMAEHTLTTSVIEIAGDRRTAKGVWVSPGHETLPLGERPIAHWCWNRYGADFILEKGEWKIWHLHIYSTIRTPYDTDWVESSINRPKHLPPLGELMPGFHPPDLPVTFNQPYSIDTARDLEPRPPEPYRTFGETWSYTDPPQADA